jgi:nitrate reductase NapE component
LRNPIVNPQERVGNRRGLYFSDEFRHRRRPKDWLLYLVMGLALGLVVLVALALASGLGYMIVWFVTEAVRRLGNA